MEGVSYAASGALNFLVYTTYEFKEIFGMKTVYDFGDEEVK